MADLAGQPHWHVFGYAFGATLLGAPMLLTITAAGALGPISLAFAMLGVALASLPLYTAGLLVRRLGVRLPTRIETLALRSSTPAIAAAVTPSYALYWVVAALAGLPLWSAAKGSLAVSLPLALLFGLTTVTGQRVGLPPIAVSAATLCAYFVLRTASARFLPARRAS